MSDLEEILRKRRTSNLFEPTTVPREIINEALGLALTAPNHKHTFPWEFVVLGEQKKARISEQMVQNSRKKQPQKPEEFHQQIGERLKNPTVIAFLQRKDGVEEGSLQDQEDYAACCCALLNTCLFFTERGYQTKWSTGQMTRSQETFQLMNWDPSLRRCVGFLMVGLSQQKLPPQRRPKLESCLQWSD